MPLQIRRGTTAQRLSIVPLQGEPIFDTDLNLLYIGNGVTPGGQPLTGISLEDARDATGAMLANGNHNNIIFTYGPEQDINDRIDAQIDLSAYDGEIAADSFRGSLFANDSSLIIDSNTKNIIANDIIAASLSVSNLSLTETVSADLKGSLFGDNSTRLVNAIDNSINLDGTVKGDIVPDLNEVYDLGSPSNRFKDLYLSGASLFLGSAQITANGSAIELPVGSTVAGIPIGTGSGTGDGVIEGSNYKINIIADNSTVMVNSDTGDFFGTLTGNLFGNVTGNVLGTLTGNVFGNVTGDILGNLTGNVTGNVDGEVTGNVTGNVSGDLFGNVTGDVSGNIVGEHTGIVKADNGEIILTNGATGADAVFNGRVIGQLIGDVKGSLFSDDSSLVVNGITGDIVATNLLATSSLFVAGSTTLQDQLTLNSNFQIIGDGEIRNSSIASYTPDSSGSVFSFNKYRGSEATPQTVISGDRIGNILFRGYNGTNEQTSAAIISSIEGVPSLFAIPANLEFQVRNGLGTLLTPLKILNSGIIQIRSDSNLTSNKIILTSCHHDSSATTTGLGLSRSRGTIASPVAIQTGDPIYNITWGAYSGTTYRDAAIIRTVVDGTVSSTAVPGRIEFWTSNVFGTMTKNAELDKDGVLKVDQIQALNSTLTITADIIGSIYSDASTMIIDGTDGSIKYYPSTPADWAGTPPTTIGEAIDRLAARLKLIDGGVGA